MSSSDQLQAEIEQLEAEIEKANIELDRLYSEYGQALPAEVEAWMKKHVQRRIEDNADKVNAAGVEPLRHIKADLTALIQRLPQICQASIGEQDQWPHRRVSSAKNQYEPRSGESYSAACFRRAINNLGALLAKHGLIAEKQGYTAEWERVDADQYRYAINPGFDERRFSTLKEYQGKHTAQSRQLEELEAKRQEFAKARARELWDEA